MKSKILLLMAATALVVYSCSSDRDDEVQNQTLNKVDLKKLKTDKQSGESSRIGDSIDMQQQTQIVIPPTGFDPQDPNDPEIIPPGDIKPPKP